jgi:predicted Zn finger-like uncharacterized protein
MRIVCPFCAAAYDVPDGLLAGREAVRCARCTKEWQPEVAEPPPPPERAVETRLEPPPRHAIVERPVAAPPRNIAPRGMAGGGTGGHNWAIDRLMAAPQQPSHGRLALAVAWLASIAVVLALLAAAYVWRPEIMAAWPPSVHLYAALGLAAGPP